MNRRKIFLVSLIALTLAMIFYAYLQPGFIVDLANRYILC